MVDIIKFFGVISIIVAVILGLVSIVSIILIPTLLPLAASALLGGALLIAFARVVELLEQLNEKIKPISAVALALEEKYNAKPNEQVSNTAKFDPNNPITDPFTNLPAGSQIERHFRRRVAFLPDESVIGETDKGPHKFKNFDEWRRFIGE